MTSEPASLPTIPRVRWVGSESRRRRSWNFRRLSDPAGGLAPPAVRREPFDRLKFWTIRHELRQRLGPYQASDVPRVFASSNWATLRYWALLLDEDDEGIARLAGVDTELPDPDVWFGRVKV